VRDVAVVHRLGRLVVGETSVLIVVASAHRGAAFEACRWVIDTLKKTVPIWKKEQFVDGAVWADGEAFPESVGLRGRAEVDARSADGEAFPESVSLASASGAGGSGRPSDDAHISESRYGAPGSVAVQNGVPDEDTGSGALRESEADGGIDSVSGSLSGSGESGE
ncbi:MAG: molybdenum cofactor biosynthesis protein MoaE, partial [Edaphobacter sp.]